MALRSLSEFSLCMGAFQAVWRAFKFCQIISEGGFEPYAGSLSLGRDGSLGF